MLSTLPHTSSFALHMAKGRQSFMFQEMPCLSISMERHRAIKYIKKQLVQLKCCFFLLLSCLLAARIRKLSNFPPSTFSSASFRKSFYRWGVFLLLCCVPRCCSPFHRCSGVLWTTRDRKFDTKSCLRLTVINLSRPNFGRSLTLCALFISGSLASRANLLERRRASSINNAFGVSSRICMVESTNAVWLKDFACFAFARAQSTLRLNN